MVAEEAAAVLKGDSGDASSGGVVYYSIVGCYFFLS